MNFSKMFSINNLQASALRAKSTSSVDSGTAATGSPASTARTPASSKKSATAKIVSNQISLTPEEEEKVNMRFFFQI